MERKKMKTSFMTSNLKIDQTGILTSAKLLELGLNRMAKEVSR